MTPPGGYLPSRISESHAACVRPQQRLRRLGVLRPENEKRTAGHECELCLCRTQHHNVQHRGSAYHTRSSHNIERQCDNYSLNWHRRCNNMSLTNLSGYVGHVAAFSSMFTIACCLVVGLGLGLGLDFVSGW